MKPEEAHDWARHYDSVQWTVAGILAAAIAGLLAYAYGQQRLPPGPSILGLALTLASVFFAASFRALRRRFNEYLQSTQADDVAFLRSHPLFKQWPVFLGLHILLLCAWVELLVSQH